MYFVVFIYKSNKHHVIPYSWVQEIKSNLEKFINKGLNSSQIFTFFYSEREGAIDENGRPNVNYPAIFTNNTTVFPEEGCYYGKISKYFGNICFYFLYLEHIYNSIMLV